jgi:hypothetical protein
VAVPKIFLSPPNFILSPPNFILSPPFSFLALTLPVTGARPSPSVAHAVDLRHVPVGAHHPSIGRIALVVVCLSYLFHGLFSFRLVKVVPPHCSPAVGGTSAGGPYCFSLLSKIEPRRAWGA